MGVNVYGKAFDADYKADEALFDKLGPEEFLKLKPEERPWDQTKPGAYYQDSWWGWRPLARMLCALWPEITARCTYWQSNDGDGLNALYAAKLAKALETALKDGTVADYIEARNARHRAMPDEPCKYCKATGTRTDLDDGPRQCNVCKGAGKNRPRDEAYVLDLQSVKDFAVFCRHSGGFGIH